MLQEIGETIAAVFDKTVAGIGIGVPSLVDVDKGIVYTVENIPSWQEVPLKDILEQSLPGAGLRQQRRQLLRPGRALFRRRPRPTATWSA